MTKDQIIARYGQAAYDRILERSRSVDHAAYYARHREQILARVKRYQSDNREKYLESKKATHRKCAQQEKLYQQQRRAKDPERFKAQVSAYYAKHKERLSAAYQDWSKSHPEERRQLCAARRARKKEALGSHTLAEWKAIVRKQRGRCADCGLKRKLTRDHVVSLALGGSDFAFNIQGLCFSCNSRKGKRLKTNALSLFDRAQR